ncbi:glycosyltransferase [candidate division KSB1 bacterium]|nr:glycosyltransferase [candidate division KSB1 bacterium]
MDMLGSLSYAAMQRRFDAEWVQAVPSLWPEPFGLVVIDAILRGTVLAASDCGGLRHTVVPGKSGVLLPTGDIEQRAAALTDLLSDRSKVQRMGNYGQKHARLYFGQDRLLSDKFRNSIDWSATTAFSIPSYYTGFIRVNLSGREPEGIVAAGAEYDDLLDRITADLYSFVDPASGKQAVQRVARTVNLFACDAPGNFRCSCVHSPAPA